MIVRALVLLAACSWISASSLAQETSPGIEQAPGAIPLDSQGRPDVGPVRPASKFLGSRVTAHGHELGTVKDLALDLAEGYVSLVIVQPSKAGSDERIALPPYILKEENSGLVVVESISAELLDNLERLTADTWREKANRLWACQLYSQFELQAPWEDRRGGTWGGQSTYCQLFDASRMQTLSGTIKGIDYVAPQPGMALGTQLVIETDEGLRSVQLGPLWFLSRGSTTFAPGAPVTVKGSQVELDGEKFLMAASVQMEGQPELQLRTAEGKVAWPDWSEADDMFSFALFGSVQGTPIENSEGKSLGRVQDLAIGLESGLIAYAAVENPEVGSNAYLPVPLSALVVPADARTWVLELPEDVFLRTPTVDRANWPEQIDRSWVEYVHVRYGRSPFGGVRREPHRDTHQGGRADQADRKSS